MNILIVTPAPVGSRQGNRVTAQRWARLLRQLGHRVVVAQEYQNQSCDVLVALHAHRSFASVERFHRHHPDRPLILAMTGTDLYNDIHTSQLDLRSLEWASRLIVLQPLGINELPQHLRDKARVIYQSATTPTRLVAPLTSVFQVCVLAHLRPVKDPLRAALASRLLPASSRVRVVHSGAALTDDMARQARAEMASNPRYRWLGDQPQWRARRILARSRLLVLSSQLEGGANVLSEALAASVPILSTRIPGSIGILGADYPGYFPVGDTSALADLLARAEADANFYTTLKDWCERLRPLVEPGRERQSWNSLLDELFATSEEVNGQIHTAGAVHAYHRSSPR